MNFFKNKTTCEKDFFSIQMPFLPDKHSHISCSLLFPKLLCNWKNKLVKNT